MEFTIKADIDAGSFKEAYDEEGWIAVDGETEGVPVAFFYGLSVEDVIRVVVESVYDHQRRTNNEL